MLELQRRASARATRAPGAFGPSGEIADADPMPARLVTARVRGMTCRSCETRIQRHVGKLPGVVHVRASAVHGRVEVETTAPLSMRALGAAVGRAGYELGEDAWLETDPKVWATAGAGIALVVAVALLAQATGLANLAAGAGDIASGGIAVALLLGLAAGVSTCMALVGGLVLALSAAFERRAADAGAPRSVAARMRPAAVFVTGRVVGYAAFGAILGAIGASVTMPPLLTGILMIGVAVVMLLLGTRLTGLSPRLAGWSPTLPMGLGRRLGLGEGPAGENGPAAYSDARAASLGAASFFLPCGFTQAIQLFALSTGSPAFAAAVLGAFAIGTAPGLLAVAGLPVVVPARARPSMVRIVGVVVLAFAFVNAGAGFRLSGLTLPSFGPAEVAAAAPPPAALAADGSQTLTTYQDLDGYRPGNASIRAGIPTTWTIESSDAATCAAMLVVPKLGIRTLLHTGTNTIQLPALPAGRIDYMCSMGMYGASITVVAS